MVQQLQRIGDRDALLIDQQVMDQLGLKASDCVELTVRDGVLVVTPLASQGTSQERFDSALDHVMAARHDVLQRLAQ